MSRHTVDDPVAWNLPEDYNSLTLEGQRQARVAGVRLRGTPEEDVRSWHLTREYYFRDDPEDNFAPGFYDHWVEPAPGHYEWAYVAAAFPRTILTAHRGSAKSHIWSKERPLRDLMSVPRSSNFIILSSDDKIQRHTDFLMVQLAENRRIINDFGRLRPKRTEGLWNHHNLRLTNHAKLVMGTINSMNLRGERPGVITLDDIERDPKSGTNLTEMRAQTERFFFQVVLPMARAHCKVYFIGTPNSKQTLIWRLQNEPDPRIQESRFHNHSYWFFNKDGTVFWPAEYPTPESIRTKRTELGEEVWRMEMLGEDTLGEDSALQIDPVKNEYCIDDPTAFDKNDPFGCQALMTWNDSVPASDGSTVLTPRREIAGRFFSSLFRFITMDYAPTVKIHSDLSAIQVFGVDRLGQFFSLDMWGGKLLGDDLVDKVWEMARRWKVRLVGVEAVAMQVHFYSKVAERQHIMAQGGWVPQCVPIRYANARMTKPERILSCRGRFKQGLYKLPAWRAKELDYQRLRDQINGFHPDPDRNDTGLGQDDHLDTIPMAQELIGSRRATTIDQEPLADPASAIRRGVQTINGMPPGILVPLQDLPQDCVDHLLRRFQERPDVRPVVWESGGI